MGNRDISGKQRTWLVFQTEEWMEEGILSSDQTQQILDRYTTPFELAERTRSVALRALTGLAAFLVGLGVLLLVGYNWEAMPDPIKLVLIFSAILGAYGGAFVLRFRGAASLWSEVLFFLGCLFYGAGIFLIAQIFHLNAHYPDGVWWWAVGVLPFALCLDSLCLHALLVALLGLWCGMEVLGFGDLGAWFFGRWGFVPNGAYSLPILALPGILWAYRKDSVPAATLYVLLGAWWVILQPFAWELEEQSIYCIGAIGALMLVIAESHSSENRLAIPFRQIGVLLSTGTLLLLSFYEFNREIGDFRTAEGSLATKLVMIILLTVVILLTSLWKRRRPLVSIRADRPWTHPWRQLELPIGLALLMDFLLAWHVLIQEPLLPTILANIAMICVALWLIGVGLRDDRGQPFAAGVVYFLLWTVVRYIDLFGDFGGMPGAAMLFFLCGGILFGVSLYWRKRKQARHV